MSCMALLVLWRASAMLLWVMLVPPVSWRSVELWVWAMVVAPGAWGSVRAEARPSEAFWAGSGRSLLSSRTGSKLLKNNS